MTPYRCDPCRIGRHHACRVESNVGRPCVCRHGSMDGGTRITPEIARNANHAADVLYLAAMAFLMDVPVVLIKPTEVAS